MNKRLQGRVTCRIPWCTEQPSQHDEFHTRVLMSHVSPWPGSTSGALQVAAFARDVDEPRLSLIMVDHDLRSVPDHISVSPTWQQVEEIALALTARYARALWDVRRAHDDGAAAVELRPSTYGESLVLTLAQYSPTGALSSLLDTTISRRVAAVLFGARREFRALVA